MHSRQTSLDFLNHHLSAITGEDEEEDRSNFVEMATLILPQHAAEGGLEAGEGENVVLEAQKETVDSIAAAGAHSTIVSAVVDLEILSELVGISEAEFISDLHVEMAENRVFDDDDTQTHKENDNAVVATEDQPLLGLSEQEGDDVLCDRVTLTADPFIETLAETLNNETTSDGFHFAQVDNVGLQTISERFPLAEASTTMKPAERTATLDVEAGGDPDNTNTTPLEATATKIDDDQHLAHDAFLLQIPHQDGESKDHFVLALPEIRVQHSVTSSMSQVSEEDHHFSVLQRVHSLLPPMPTLELPSDVVDIQLEAHMENVIDDEVSFKQMSIATSVGDTATLVTQAQQLQLDLVVKREVPTIGYVILISGLLALSSVGAALDLQHGPSDTLKTLWRQLCTALVLSPLVLKSLYYEGIPDLSRTQWMMLPLAGAAYAYMCLAFVVALDMTTMANAFVLSNMTSLVIILGRFVVGLPVLKAEGIGALLGFAGAAVCANDAAKSMAGLIDGGGSSTAMMGNAVALSASFGTAAYLLFAKSLRSSMDIFVFMFAVMSLGSVCLVLYMSINEEAYTWDTDRNIGLFGWLNPNFDRLPLELYMAVVCNCVGTTGYIAVLKYFDPVVPSSVMLMEPVVGSLLGVLAGTAALPGAQTWFGDLIVAGGTFLVIRSGSKTTEKIEANEALRTFATGDDASTVASFKNPLIPRKRTKTEEDAPAKVVWD